MDYGKTFSRAASLVWENKFLILLGVLASLASSGSGGGGGGGGGTGQPFPNGGQPPQIDAEFAGIAVGVIIALVCVALVVGLILWAIATIARGGLISGADTIESGGKSSFGQAWGAAWQKAGTLLGIGFLPAIPGLILFVVGLLALGAYGGLSSLFGESFALPAGLSGLTTVVILIACIMLPIALVLSILRTFAERAAMLENLGVMDAYRRGTQVLRANLGEAILLFLLQIALAVGLGIVLFVPSIFMALCCFLWPLLLLIQGAITAFVSTLWTLAWRQWTDKAAPAKVVPAV